MKELGHAQMELAITLGTVAEQFVASGIDVGSPAGVALRQQMTSGITAIQHGDAKNVISGKLKDVQAKAGAGPGAVIIGLQNLGGF
jgi:hypothetical protein